MVLTVLDLLDLGEPPSVTRLLEAQLQVISQHEQCYCVAVHKIGTRPSILLEPQYPAHPRTGAWAYCNRVFLR